MTTRDPLRDTIAAITALHAGHERGVTSHQRWIERLTDALGRPVTLYAVVATVAVWAFLNAELGRRAFDLPPFSYLQGIVALAALLMAVMVLITQNRQLKLAEKRARLDLEINLLAETKIAKLISLLEELRRDMPEVPDRRDIEAEAMQEHIDAHSVAERLDASIEAEVSGETSAEPSDGESRTTH